MPDLLVRVILTVLVLPASLAGCSVLEDRGPCPCYVAVVAEEGHELRGSCLFFSFPEGEGVPDVMQLLEYGADPGGAEKAVPVPKGVKRLCLLKGQEGMYMEGNCIMVEKGREPDRLELWSASGDCSGETAVLRVPRTKHYATVHFSFGRSGDARCRFGLSVSGNSSGIDLLTMQAVKGSFHCVPKPVDNEGFEYEFRVPRQSDASLVLDLLDAATGGVGDRIMLGDILERSGYDWSKPVLDDVRLVMDHVATAIEVEVIGWEYDDIGILL